MGNTPSRLPADDLPVERVSWEACREFCKKVGLELPTEAQWEYACRAGNPGPYGGTDGLDGIGWYRGNSGGTPHPAGRKQANGFGLRDMHGNVGEWCEDAYDEGFYSSPRATEKDPVCTASSRYRVRRGGSWSVIAAGCRSSYRGRWDPANDSSGLGFRPVFSRLP